MNDLVEKGRNQTLIMVIGVIMVSLSTIILYQSGLPEMDTKKLGQQIVRFVLTVGLLWMVYNGKKWAIIVMIILFALGVLLGISSLFTVDGPMNNKMLLVFMIVVYALSIYHLGFSESFKAFRDYQNRGK